MLCAMAGAMRSRARVFLVPPYNRQLFPYQAFPPWKALLRVFDLVAFVLRRRSMPSHLAYLEIALIQASKRIVAIAVGDLPPDRWYRRARVAIDKLERAKRAIADYVVADTLTSKEAQSLVDGIDETIASLVEEVARAPIPDEIRMHLPELHVPSRLVH
jgi:hypothetical protein